ncbi:MAG: M1 family metallopeptidase [Ignavibacteriales bacterium]|nr:M1 family metallopeptidase [Ignavibacteriales bacterium]
MKVKKKYLIIALTSLFLISVLIAFGINSLIERYNISYVDSERFVKSGFSIQTADIEEIEDYIPKEADKLNILHYEIHLELNPIEKQINSKTIITGTTNVDKVKNIELNFNDGFRLSKVLLNDKKCNYNYENDKLIIISDKIITDTFKVEISYRGEPENLGFGSFTFAEYKNSPVVYTINEPIFASTWFPCNDVPNDKVLTDIFITNDSNMTSVSNGILVSESSKMDRKTAHWKTTYPISTYLISIYSAKYLQYEDLYISNRNDSMAIKYYVFEDKLEKAKRDFAFHPTAIKYFSEMFGEYPFLEEKYGVAEFLWSYGAMENQTITGIGQNFISGHKFFTGMLVHELAHQWWGNAVTISNWNDIWLNEGFATYSEALYWEKESDSSALKSTMRKYLTDFSDTRLFAPEELFSRTVYNKGAWVLHMLRKEVGDETFFAILKKYYENFKYKNVSTIDFIKVVEELTGENYNYFFKQWIFDGIGKIELEYNYKLMHPTNNYTDIELNIDQVQNGYETYNFTLDLDFYIENKRKIRKTVKIDERTENLKFNFNYRITKIDLDPDNWVAAEIQYKESEN